MSILNYTKNVLTLTLGGSTSMYPSYMMIGSGSGTYAATQTSLIAPRDRQLVTATSYPTSTSVKWQGDWTSVEISGTQLREFGMTGSASALTGSMWSRSTFPAITFDGTNELRIEEVWEVF